MVLLKIDENRLTATITLIENHLDGAVADYENGNVENVEFLEDLAYMHKQLNRVATHGWSELAGDEYVKRIAARREQLAKEKKEGRYRPFSYCCICSICFIVDSSTSIYSAFISL